MTTDGDLGKYLKAKEHNERCLAQARKRIEQSDLELYSSAIESLQYLGSNVESDKTVLSRQRGPSSRTALLLGLEGKDANGGQLVTPERRTNPQTQKRRKILKDLKCFTKNGDTRKETQKGWSNAGYRYHEKMTEQILFEEQLNKPFVDLYCKITRKIELRMAEIAHPNKKKRYVPNRKTVWQLR